MPSKSIKKVLSFLWPIISKVESQYNGTLEISWYNGRKMLNSKNANYSYGKLQKVLVFGLSKMTFSKQAPVLILGLGGGSIIRPLRNRFGCTGKITAVECDEVVFKLSETEFDISKSGNVNKVLADAFTYVENCNETYGLIIVDLFVDNIVPVAFYSIPFWENLLAITQQGGSILFNAGLYIRGDSSILKVASFLNEKAKVIILENVEDANTLVLARFE
ncbi:spermidine synthase [Owenweeksia hongkongensis DSM 17368]|uniref:Spermidine synthase n=2 Tax=Owenweeksia TaxID=267986 RepID=G8R8B0_OWEHD|nr:spermidine synthase [Owenweeksia hongkongensis DSM 17368]